MAQLLESLDFIIEMCFFHVNLLSIKIPKNFVNDKAGSIHYGTTFRELTFYNRNVFFHVNLLSIKIPKNFVNSTLLISSLLICIEMCVFKIRLPKNINCL